MNDEGPMHSAGARFRTAFHVVSREGPGPTESHVGWDELRRELVELEVLLESHAAELFAGHQPSAGVADAPSNDAESNGAGHLTYALAMAASLLLVVVALWSIGGLNGRPSPATSWRSGPTVELSVTAELDGGRLRLRWDDVSQARWYRVSVISSSGALIARRDLESDCACLVEVRVPEGAERLYWLVEGFDDQWIRTSMASGHSPMPLRRP